MSASQQNGPATASTPGAHRAQPGEHVFQVAKLGRVVGGPDYSTAYGGCVEGERMMMAVMKAPRGHAAPHSHPNEQWIYVVEGEMEFIIGGVTYTAHRGDIVYIPANAVHVGRGTSEHDAMFVTVKDTSHGLQGTRTE